MWPTPRANKTSDENEDAWMKRHDAGKVATPPLALAVKMYPTPRAEDSQSCGAHRGTPDTLTAFTKMFPTPNTRDWKDSGPTQGNRHSPNLGPVAGGQLNPDWVELLMGWPLGWTRTDGTRPDMEGWQGAHAGGVPWGEGTAWERGVPRVEAKIPNRVGRLKCIGNGQVPAAMRLAWESLRNNRRDIHEML